MITRSNKGFAGLIVILVATFLLGASGYVFRDKILNQTSKNNELGGNTTHSNLDNLTSFKNNPNGFELRYTTSTWMVSNDAQNFDYAGNLLFSNEQISEKLSKNAHNAIYTFNLDSATAESQGKPKILQNECQGNYINGQVNIATAANDKISGCKIVIFASGKTQPGRIIEFFYVINPKSKMGLTFSGRSEEIHLERVDEIFKHFEDVIKTLAFYQPIVSVNKPADFNTTKNSIDDDHKVAELYQIKNNLDYYHQEYSDYPVSIDFSAAPNSKYKADFRYFRCSKDTFHLGVSLSSDAALNDPNSVGSFAIRSGPLCVGDPIDGSQTKACAEGDTGNFCYDLGPKKVSKADTLTGSDKISFYLQQYKFVPIFITLQSNNLTGPDRQTFVTEHRDLPNYQQLYNDRSVEIARLENSVLDTLLPEDFELIYKSPIDLTIQGNISKTGLEKLKGNKIITDIYVDKGFDALHSM